MEQDSPENPTLHMPLRGFSVGVFTDSEGLSMYGLFLVGAAVGAGAGMLIKLYKVLLEWSIEFWWTHVPHALATAGWTADSPFPLINYAWMIGGLFGFLVGALSASLLGPEASPSLGKWVKHLHDNPKGSAPAGYWLISLILLGLITVWSGASVGPEPTVVIMPSVLAGALAAGPMKQSRQVTRTIALAGGAGGLSAFFALPIASAFMVLEVPNVDGAQFALEALPAAMAASITGTIFGNSVWNPGALLGHSHFKFPGGDVEGPASKENDFGLGALAYAMCVGLLGGIVAHLLVVAIRAFHCIFAQWKGEHGGHESHTAGHVPLWKRSVRHGLVLAAVGAVNGAVGMIFPSALFWGEGQLQIALTRGCVGGRVESKCMPMQLPYIYPDMIPTWSVQANTGKPISALSMALLSSVKVLLIAMGEASGFVGGAIYPVAFAGATLGSAVGARPGIASMGGQFVYLSTAAAMAVSISALLNTPLFAVFLVVVLQENVPHGVVSTQMIALTCAVYVHHALARGLIIPRLNLMSSQRPRKDIRYVPPE